MTIKHIIFPSGGPAGFISYGAVRQLAKKNIFDVNNIESIYGSSVGSLIGAIVCMKYNWDWLDDFFYKRPWEQVIKITPDNIINFFTNQYLLNDDTFYKVMEPLLKGKDMTTDVTMKEFYEKTQVDLNIYATNINGLELEKIVFNHVTYPNIKLCKAITISSTIPGIMKQVFMDDMCLIDGGCLSQFPATDCIENENIDNDSILAFKNVFRQNVLLDKDSGIADVYMKMLWMLISKANVDDEDTILKKVKYIVYLNATTIEGISSWSKYLEDSIERNKLIDQGIFDATIFKEYHKL